MVSGSCRSLCSGRSQCRATRRREPLGRYDTKWEWSFLSLRPGRLAAIHDQHISSGVFACKSAALVYRILCGCYDPAGGLLSLLFQKPKALPSGTTSVFSLNPLCDSCDFPAATHFNPRLSDRLAPVNPGNFHDGVLVLTETILGPIH